WRKRFWQFFGHHLCASHLGAHSFGNLLLELKHIRFRLDHRSRVVHLHRRIDCTCLSSGFLCKSSIRRFSFFRFRAILLGGSLVLSRLFLFLLFLCVSINLLSVTFFALFALLATLTRFFIAFLCSTLLAALRLFAFIAILVFLAFINAIQLSRDTVTW